MLPVDVMTTYDEDRKKLPKRFRKTSQLPSVNQRRGTIVKTVRPNSENLTLADIPFEDGLTPKLNMRQDQSSTTYMSLNKKARWRLLDHFRHDIKELNNQFENVRVSVTENQERYPLDKPACTAYHGMLYDEWFEEWQPVHRYANHQYADPHTLSQPDPAATKKHKTPWHWHRPPYWHRQRTSRKISADEAVEERSKDDPGTIQVEYSIWKPVDNVKLLKAQQSRIRSERSCLSCPRTVKNPKPDVGFYEAWEADEPHAPYTDAVEDLLKAAIQNSLETVGTTPIKSRHSVSLADFIVPIKQGSRKGRQRSRKYQNSESSATDTSSEAWTVIDEDEKDFTHNGIISVIDYGDDDDEDFIIITASPTEFTPCETTVCT